MANGVQLPKPFSQQSSGFGLEQLNQIIPSIGNFADIAGGSVLESQGSKIKAQGYRNAATAALRAVKFNNSIDKLDTIRRTNSSARQLNRIAAQQQVQSAASGVAGGASSLAIMDATLDSALRVARDEAISLSARQGARLFEGESKAAALETKAQSEEFTARQNRIRSIPKALGGLGAVFQNITGALN